MEDDLRSIANEHNTVVVIERLTHHIARVREQQRALLDEQRAMRDAITRMSEAITRLALVEERQATTSQAIERVMAMVERIDERVRALEVAEPGQRRVQEWAERAALGAIVLVATFVAYKVGLLT
jgi:response regulator RpfG family c-di-GMP phosphodiesterase